MKHVLLNPPPTQNLHQNHARVQHSQRPQRCW
jgi:hypothetical protein